MAHGPLQRVVSRHSSQLLAIEGNDTGIVPPFELEYWRGDCDSVHVYGGEMQLSRECDWRQASKIKLGLEYTSSLPPPYPQPHPRHPPPFRFPDITARV